MLYTIKQIKGIYTKLLFNTLVWGEQSIFDKNSNLEINKDELSSLEEQITKLGWDNDDLIKEISDLKDKVKGGHYDLSNENTKIFFDDLESRHKITFKKIRENYNASVEKTNNVIVIATNNVKDKVKATTQTKEDTWELKENIKELSKNEQIINNFDFDNKTSVTIVTLQRALVKEWHLKEWPIMNSIDWIWGPKTNWAYEKALDEIKPDKNIQNFQEQETKETISEFHNHFLWIKIGTESRLEAMNDVNKSSLNELLKSSNLSQLLGKLETAEKENKANVDLHDFSSGAPIDPRRDILRNSGYDPKGLFWDKELVVVTSVIENYVRTQEKIPSLSAKDQIKILFDFDKSGALTIDKNFYVWELQMDFHTFDSLTSDWADTLFKNLGLGTIDSFATKMSTNLFSARETFQRALAVQLNMWIKPSELVKTWWTKEAVNEIYKTREENVKIIGEKVDEHIKTNLKDLEWVDSKAIKLEAIGLILGNGNLWAWASFDIEKMNLFFESLQVWVVNGIPWITISKDILEKNGFNIKGSLTNIFIPSLSGSYTTQTQIDEFKKLNPNQIDWKTSLSLYAVANHLWKVVWVSFNKVDEDTFAWIEKMTVKMSELLKQVSNDIEAWKSFDESSFWEISENKLEDAQIYNEMKTAYETYAKGTEFSEAFLTDMMQWYLAFYENTLYSNAEWTKLTSIGWWIALLAWFLPIPYLTLWGEHINTNWNETLHSIEREKIITNKEIHIGKVGAIEINHKGKDTLMFEDAGKFNISNSTWDTQAERVGNNLYLSWNLSNITINEHTTNKGVEYTIVINWGTKDSDWLYIDSNLVDITSNAEGLSISDKEIQTYDIDAMKSTESIRTNLFNIIQEDALNHPKTIWMQKLQRMTFDYKRDWEPTLDRVWEQFEKVVNHPWFEIYATQKGSENELPELFHSLSLIKTDNEKALIIQSVSSNFMKKTALQNVDWVITMKEGQTILEYNKEHNRTKFFDKQFATEFPELLPQIQEARQAWYDSNWDKAEFSFKSISDGSIAFTWVESRRPSWRINVHWIMPYTWAYNIASTGWKDFINIDWKSKEVINSIPNRVLENIKISLNNVWANLSNTQDVKDFINNWWDNWIKVDYKLAFAKMWECLNDAVVLRDLTIIKGWKEIKFGATSTSEVYSPEHNVVNVWVAVTWETNEEISKENIDPLKDPNVQTTPGTWPAHIHTPVV